MYSFAQRDDTLVVDEPLYSFYLCNTKARDYHPGAAEIISSQENDGEKVIHWMKGNHDKPVIFFKNMSHHLLDLDRSFMKDMVNVILTRDPKEMIPSFARVIENPTITDIGYADHTNLQNYFEENNIPYIVLDSKLILQNSKGVLQQFCELIGINFDDNMLKWEKGPRKEDGVWSKYWYGNIHDSEGFMKYRAKLESFPERYKSLLDACTKHYEKLVKKALR
jgi:glutaredoxin-related protein